MPALDAILQQKLQLLAAKGLSRAPRASERTEGVRVKRAGRELISFACNDYLGLSRHPEVVEAARAATAKYGVGAGASRLVTGEHPLYDELEAALAELKGTDAGCVFGSGYLANIGAIPALVGAGDLVLADRLVHACMIDAARLSGATVMRFAHNNIEHCRMLLATSRAEHHHCLILTETVFSMDGDRAPIAELQDLAILFDAWVMTDDAHGLGLIDSPPVEVQMGTLSKAAGSYGGYVCGSKTLIDYLKGTARSLIYTTALPPGAVAASLAAIRIIAREPQRARKPLEHAKRFTALLGLKEAQSAIVPVIVKESERALVLSAMLEEKGFLVAAIRPPTVPENTARLRFAFSALHERAQVEAVAALIKEHVSCDEPSP